MQDILYLTNMDRQFGMMRQALENVEQSGQFSAQGQVLFLNDQHWGDCWQRLLAGSRLVIISWMGSGRDTAFLEKTVEFLRQRQILHAVLATDPQTDDSYYGISPEERALLQQYLLYSGRENYRNFWLWLLRKVAGTAELVGQPRQLPWNGIYHPPSGQVFTDSAEYRRQYWQKGRPGIGILFSREEWLWGDLEYQTAFMEVLESYDVNVMPVFSQWAAIPELGACGIDQAVLRYFCQDGLVVIDALVNTIKFSLTVGRRGDREFLRRLDVPVIQAYSLLRSRQEWQDDMAGLTPLEVSCSLAMPEFDGVIHSIPVAAKEWQENGTVRFRPIRERIDLAARKAKKWALLRRKDNADKKIAIIFHNYPAANSNIGSAQGLDSPESVRRLLEAMQAEGYTVGQVPPDSHSFMEEILRHATNDRRFINERQLAEAVGTVSAACYREWFSGVTPKNREQMAGDWGEPPGEVFCYEDELIVPGLRNGNILITVQPPRGFGEDPDKIYHSPDCTPTHHYLAYYHWLRDIWQADAVVHVGTHGSLEWLPGKGAGLSRECYPDLALGDLPNVYPYLITVVGEGTQAKRRGAACLIGHLLPPMDRADTYDELAELEKLLDEYCHFRQNQPGNEAVVEALIREQAAVCNIVQDVAQNAEESFAGYVLRLHSYITDIKNMQIRVGLHVLGQPPCRQGLVEYILALTRLDNKDVPSLPQTLAALHGHNYYELLEQSGALLPDGRTYGALLDEINTQARQLVELLAEAGFNRAESERVRKLAWVAAAPPGQQNRIVEISRYICAAIVPNLAATKQEITHLLAALSGRFVPPGPAGAPTSGMADILPTGRNFYGVDPRLLPTEAAWRIGQTLADSVISQYIAEESHYPENIGMVLWSGANMRSHGQCIAQFLYFLGVRPQWQRGSRRVTGLEVIPLAELKRPRIDVMARISGLFRDTQPMAVGWLDQAVGLVADLEEPPAMNYVRKHVQEAAGELEKQGTDGASAWKQACYRVFGCPPGTYGAGVGSLLEEKNWQSVDDLAKVYVRWGAHAYGTEADGMFVPELFTRRLATLDVTVKNEDNREVHMLNSDDFNAYHGGMIAAVRSLKGQSPKSYCGDSSDRSHVLVRTLEEEFKRLFRGEVMNPKYIEGMKQHGYKGAADLAGTVAHCYEWDATSEVMENWMYDDLARKYALDAGMQEWMREANPWALQRMAEKLLEASQRGMWQPNEEMQQQLQQLYLDIEGELEGRCEK